MTDRSVVARLRDYVALVKPRINGMALVVAALSLWLAPGEIGTTAAALSLLGIVLVVGAANALNMFIERDVDSLMERTRQRPLPAGRLAPRASLAFGLVLAAVSLPLLWLVANPLTAVLSAVALLNYVLVYTPLKTRTPWAVLVGAVSGAMPVLMGWTAVTNAIDLTGLALFLMLFTWQVPHFLAISLFRKSEYAAAGIRVVPNVHGDATAKLQTVASTAVLVALTLLLVPMGSAGWAYGIGAAALGAWLFVLALRGLAPAAGAAWAKGFFHASLVYFPALMAVLVLDVVVR